PAALNAHALPSNCSTIFAARTASSSVGGLDAVLVGCCGAASGSSMSALTPLHHWVPSGSCRGAVRISVQRWLPSDRRRQYLTWKGLPPQNDAATSRVAVTLSSRAAMLTTGELRGAPFSS